MCDTNGQCELYSEYSAGIYDIQRHIKEIASLKKLTEELLGRIQVLEKKLETQAASGTDEAGEL